MDLTLSCGCRKEGKYSDLEYAQTSAYYIYSQARMGPPVSQKNKRNGVTTIAWRAGTEIPTLYSQLQLPVSEAQ